MDLNEKQDLFLKGITTFKEMGINEHDINTFKENVLKRCLLESINKHNTFNVEYPTDNFKIYKYSPNYTLKSLIEIDNEIKDYFKAFNLLDKINQVIKKTSLNSIHKWDLEKSKSPKFNLLDKEQYNLIELKKDILEFKVYFETSNKTTYSLKGVDNINLLFKLVYNKDLNLKDFYYKEKQDIPILKGVDVEGYNIKAFLNGKLIIKGDVEKLQNLFLNRYKTLNHFKVVVEN